MWTASVGIRGRGNPKDSFASGLPKRNPRASEFVEPGRGPYAGLGALVRKLSYALSRALCLGEDLELNFEIAFPQALPSKKSQGQFSSGKRICRVNLAGGQYSETGSYFRQKQLYTLF